MTNKEILFVCTEKKLSDFTKEFFEKTNKNYSIHISNSVKKVIKLIQKQTFDVIISDYNLNKGSGLEILTYLKDNKNETPFILLIDPGKEDIAIEAFNLGVEYFIQKNSNLKSFISILTNYIDNLIKKKTLIVNLENEKKLAQHYLDIVDTIVLILDTTGNIVQINKTGCEILGQDLSKILGKNWFTNYIPKNNQINVQEVFKQILEDDSNQVIRYENPIITSSGEERIISWHNQLLKNKEGKVYATLSNGEDITDRKATEEELKKSEEKYIQLFHSINDPIFLYEISSEGTAGLFVEVNELGCSITGYSREEILKMNPLDILHFDPPEEAIQVTPIIVEKGQLTFERTLKKKDGSFIQVEINALIFSFEGEDVVLTIARDITERKEINTKLKEIAANLQERLKELNCLYQVTQYVLPEGRPISDYFEYILSIIPPAWFYPESTCARIIYNKKEYQSNNFIETKWKLSSNLMIHDKMVGALEVYYMGKKPQRDFGPFLKEEQNLIHALTRHITDFISKKEDEEELRKSKEYYQAVADSAFAGIIIVDLNENLTYVNDSFTNMLNYNSKELLGMNLSEITTEKEYLKYELQTQRRRIDGRSDSYESIMLKKDKTPVNVFLSVTPLTDKNGKITEALGVIIDISSLKVIEKKLLERQGELEQQRDELNSFASTIAHDIRGRMQFISFYNSMIESEYSKNIDDSIDEILQFIEDILVLSRTGEILSKKTYVDIAKLAEKITIKITKLNPEIIFNIEEIPKIFGDPVRLYQVFENLLMNVLKHANATRIIITSKTTTKEICISIIDNGKGMSEKTKQTIIDSWITRRYTSFGMLIVNKIIEAHNGRISLESELGKGTTVNLYFPIR